jgi:hypothetical protein
MTSCMIQDEEDTVTCVHTWLQGKIVPYTCSLIPRKDIQIPAQGSNARA